MPRSDEARSALLGRATALLRELEGPTPSDEVAAGWTPEKVADIREYLEGLIVRLRHEPAEFLRGDIHFARAMDHTNVSSGRWLDEAAALSVGVYDLVAEEEGWSD